MNIFLKIVLALCISCSTASAADALPPAGTAALVNGAVITTAEFRGELARILRLRKHTEQDLDPTLLAQTKKEALETLIGRELLYQESRRKGIRVSDSAVEAEITLLRKKFSSTEEFKASLVKLNLSEVTITSQISRGMAIQKLIDAEFGVKTVITDAVAKSYYDSHPDEFLHSGKDAEGRPKAALPFEDVRDRIIKQLQRERTLREVTSHLKRLRENARVEIHLEDSGE